VGQVARISHRWARYAAGPDAFLVMLRGLAEQADNFVGMELTDPAIDFIGLARSLGIESHRAATVKDATDLIGKALKDNKAMLIDVDMERGYKPM